MDKYDVIVSNDYSNLTNEDIDKIFEVADITTDDDRRKYVEEHLASLLESPEVEEIIDNKIFVGKCSVKWYKIHFANDSEKDELRRKIESDTFGYNTRLDIDRLNLSGPRIYTCVKMQEDKYLVRTVVPSGYRKISDGDTVRKIPNISNDVIIIDLNNNYLEIRTNYRDSVKIQNTISTISGIACMNGNGILYRYNDDIEEFRDHINAGKFLESKSIPDIDIEMSENDTELLSKVLSILDGYFINKDIEMLAKELGELDISTYKGGFTQLLLAGLAKIGIGIRENNTADLSNQLLYSVLKPYISNSAGYVSFSLPNAPDKPITILVGLNTNNISFRSSVGEDAIEYIRDIIL